MAKTSDYTTISIPYNSLLERSNAIPVNPAISQDSVSQQADISSSSSSGGSSGDSNGIVEEVPARDGGSFGDVWITTFIRSKNWKPKTVGFNIDGQTGYAEFTNVFVSGTIEALEGLIGGFEIGSDYIRDAGNSFGMASTVTGGNDVRFWSGATFANRGTAPFVIFEDGAIGSGSFVSGPLGKGWRINSDWSAEFQNITVRGVIKSAVFEKDTISAVNGMVLVSSADILDADMTALDSSTLTIKGETTFSANEVIRIKDGTNDEWMTVTNAASAPTYTVARDAAGSYAPNANPIWKKGTTVVSMGVGTGTKTGFILMDSSSANSPYIDVYGRNSNTYSDYTIHGRFGWLKGIVDSTVGLSGTDVWGLYTDNAYIKGTIVSATGSIGGWTIGSTYIRDTATTVGMSSAVTGGDDIRFWAGHATMASAPFRVYESGALVASNATLGGTLTAGSNVQVGAISGHSGLSLNGSADYNNIFFKRDSDGVVFFRVNNGGANSLTYDSSSGVLNITGVITGGTLQTATTGYRTVINSSNVLFYSSAIQTGFIRPDAASSMVIGSSDEIWMTDLSGTPHFKFSSLGRIYMMTAGSFINWPSGMQITDNSSNLGFSGSVKTGNTFISSDGSSGTGITSVKMVTLVAYNGVDGNYRRDRTLTFKDGILTSISGESANIPW